MTLPSRVGEAMDYVLKDSPDWHNLKTSLWDAHAARNLHYGHSVDTISPLSGQVCNGGKS
ncbi:hypothetical protein [Polymorphospora sp. A560]|uniref:Uncharacterized protein n=1 Tax=Polymorphospora lycopeni TaxID=3140240 RepID=A0ABV5CLD6_9ACTN